jgi:acetyl-CoA acetyltransferase
MRTPVGRFGGAFRDVAAVDLGAIAVGAAIDQAAAASTAGDPQSLAG